MEALNISRLEIINHAKNNKQVGRLLTLYQELGDFDTVSIDYQDGGKTLKIFLQNKKMESKRIQCAACGVIHYEIICPNCGSVVSVEVKDN